MNARCVINYIHRSTAVIIFLYGTNFVLKSNNFLTYIYKVFHLICICSCNIILLQYLFWLFITRLTSQIIDYVKKLNSISIFVFHLFASFFYLMKYIIETLHCGNNQQLDEITKTDRQIQHATFAKYIGVCKVVCSTQAVQKPGIDILDRLGLKAWNISLNLFENCIHR